MKKEIPVLKEPKLSKGEFVWRVKFPDVERYDRIRSRYNSYLSDGLIKADELMLDELARKVPRAGTVLDVASGMGTLLLTLTERRRGAIMGTDVDESPLRGAMLKLKQKKSYRQVSLCVMDAKHLAIKSGMLPGIVSHFGFDNIPDVRRALSEAHRVLRPGGELLFSSILLQEGSRSLRQAAELGFGDIATEAGLATTLEMTGFRIDSIKSFYSGRWGRNPMDLIPFEGDWFAHSLVQAHKK